MNIILSPKNKVKIIITDSGLGGLSVHALLDKHLRLLPKSFDVELLFFNALASHSLGYNSIKSLTEKLKIFNNALTAMLRLKPDIVLIACNTLSALYPLTEISKKIKIPVISIIDLAVEMISENMTHNIKNKIIIFGTVTTVNSGIYKKKLLGKNISESDIVTQACKNLESEIQINSQSIKVKNIVEECVNDVAVEKNGNNNIIVVLACTHYGYSKNIFEEKLKQKFGNKIKILNPNEKMGKIIDFDTEENKNVIKKIGNNILSRVDISETEINNIGKLLVKDSKNVAEALTNYSLKEKLFKIK